MTEHPHAQSQYQVRFDWGLEGALAIGPGADVIVVVDVLSFSTSVDIAVAAGIEIIPSAHQHAAGLAALHSARLAGDRGEAISVSPASLLAADLPPGSRIVLPSPNGSRIAAALTSHSATIIAGSLRNRAAVIEWILSEQESKGDRFTVAVIAAGEMRRNDPTIRFGVEDLLGAGAIIDGLADAGIDYYSPEAAVACTASSGLHYAMKQIIRASASGQELAQAGHEHDVELALQFDCSAAVPVFREFRFLNARSR